MSEVQIERAKWLYDGEIAVADQALQKIVRAAYRAGPDERGPGVAPDGLPGQGTDARPDEGAGLGI